jgi:hypothetical protein
LPVGGLKDAEKVLMEIEGVLGRHANNARIEERAQGTALSLLPLFTHRYESVSEEVERVRRRVRSRPAQQVDWNWVDDTIDDLRRELNRLRRLLVKCEALVKEAEQRRGVQELMARIDRKRSMCDALAE